jgi:hypothetical protein
VIIKGLGYLGRLMVKPFIILPLIYLLICFVLPPNIFGMVTYVLTKKVGMTIEYLAIVDNVSGVVFYFIFLIIIPKIKSVPLWKLFVYGNLARLSFVLLYPIFFDSPMWLIISTRILYQITSRFTRDFFIVPMVVRISKHLPEGFESTGVVVVLAASYTASNYSTIFGKDQQIHYKIKNGYYNRGLEMFVFNQFLTVALTVISPLFLAWG